MSDDNISRARDLVCDILFGDTDCSSWDDDGPWLATPADMSSAIAAAMTDAETRGRIAGLVEARDIYQEGSVSGQDGKPDWWDTFSAYTAAISARLAALSREPPK